MTDERKVGRQEDHTVLTTALVALAVAIVGWLFYVGVAKNSCQARHGVLTVSDHAWPTCTWGVR